jgi:hypothetical protein
MVETQSLTDAFVFPLLRSFIKIAKNYLETYLEEKNGNKESNKGNKTVPKNVATTRTEN